MPWHVQIVPKRKNDVHGLAVILKHPDGGEPIELSRIAFWRRPEVAARSKEQFEKVLEDESTKAEKAAEIANRYEQQAIAAVEQAQRERDQARKEAYERARAEVEELFKPSLAKRAADVAAGKRPEFE